MKRKVNAGRRTPKSKAGAGPKFAKPRPVCVDCAHHEMGMVHPTAPGREGYMAHQCKAPVTVGFDSVIGQPIVRYATCAEQRSSLMANMPCGPEGKLFKPKKKAKGGFLVPADFFAPKPRAKRTRWQRFLSCIHSCWCYFLPPIR